MGHIVTSGLTLSIVSNWSLTYPEMWNGHLDGLYCTEDSLLFMSWQSCYLLKVTINTNSVIFLLLKKIFQTDTLNLFLCVKFHLNKRNHEL